MSVTTIVSSGSAARRSATPRCGSRGTGPIEQWLRLTSDYPRGRAHKARVAPPRDTTRWMLRRDLDYLAWFTTLVLPDSVAAAWAVITAVQ
jgi:hypothetical protein